MIVRAKTNSTEIFNLYASHNTIITYVSMALDFYDNMAPPYGTGLVFELRRKANQHTVWVSITKNFPPHTG